MKKTSFEAIIRALNGADVRYVVAGGVAVNAHGYLRFTKDIDLVVQLERSNILRALAALASLGYQTRIPASAEQIADPKLRAAWIKDKEMKVLNLFSDSHRQTPIDIFVIEPFDFDREFEQALIKDWEPGLSIRFVSLATLIAMKRAVGRTQDLLDVEQLEIRRGKQ